MAYYDGYLNFNTKIDDSGMISGLKRLQSLAKKSAVAIGSGIAAGLVASTKAGMDFEAQMSKVQAISGASAGEIQALTEKAKQMGVETKFSATEAGEALEYMAMAGWKTEDMLSGIPGIMNLAAASGEDLGQVSDIVTDALTAFGLQAQDSSHFADVLATASSNANTNVSLMGATFKYVAPVAGAMKFSIEDTAQAIGLMANAGIKGEQAGTALRAMFTRLAKPPKDAAEAMSALNLVITNSDGSFKSLSDILTEMRSKFSKLTDEQKTQYAAALAGQEAMSGLLAIVNASGSDFDKLAGAIANADGASKKMADTMNDNLKGQIVLLGSSMESLGLAIYDGISEPMKEAVKSGIGSINELTESINGGELQGAVSNIGELFGGLVSGAAEITETALPAVIHLTSAIGEHSDVILTAVGAVVGYKAAFLALAATQEIITWGKAVSGTITAIKDAKMLGITYSTLYQAAILKDEAALKMCNAAGLTDITVKGGQVTATNAATGATLTFNKALMANPVGMVVGAIGILVGVLTTYAAVSDNASGSTRRLSKELDSMAESYESAKKSAEDSTQSDLAKLKIVSDTIPRLEELANKTNRTAEENREYHNIVDGLNEAMPDLKLAIDNETGALNMQIGVVWRAVEAYQALAKAKSLENLLVEAETNKAKAQKFYDENIESWDKAIADDPSSKRSFYFSVDPAMTSSMSDKEKATAALYANDAKSKALSEIKKYTNDSEQWGKQLKELNEAAIKAQKDVDDARETLNNGGGSSGGGSSGGTSYGGSSSKSSSSGGSSSAEKESKSRAEAYKKGVEQEIEAEERKFSILKRRGQVSKKDYAANIAYRADCYRGYADAVLKQDGITAQEQAEIRKEWIEKAEELETEYLLEYINMDKEALDKQRKNGEITQREYWNKLTALRDKYFAEGSDEWITYSDEIIELQKQSITEVYTEIAQQAKDSLSDIESAQSSLESKLKGFGNIFKQNVIRKAGDHGEDLSFVTLRNFEEENKALLAYEDALEQFRERGAEILGDDFSAFFAQFSEMSVEEGTEAVRALLSASDEEFEESLNGWKEYQRNSERFAENYYKSQKEKMLSELRESFDNVSDEFFDSGEYAAEAFGEGFFSQIEEIFRDISDAISLQMTNLTPQLSIAASPVSGGTTYNNTTYNLLSSGESVRQQIQAIDAAETVKKMRGM